MWLKLPLNLKLKYVLLHYIAKHDILLEIGTTYLVTLAAINYQHARTCMLTQCKVIHPGPTVYEKT